MKNYVIITRRVLLIITAAVLSAVFLCVVFLSAPKDEAVSASKKFLPIYCTEQQSKKISISFDAAWGNEDTEQLIEILAKYNVKTTFFAVSEWVEKYPESVKALADAGHEVCNHSSTHPHMSTLSKQDMVTEIENCNSKIEALTGKRPLLFRAPYGDYNNALIEVIGSLDMYCIQWDVDSLDWKDISPSDISSRVLSKVKPGSIVLFHNAAKNTPAALPGILEKLISDGYEIVPISSLIYRDGYTIDHEGRQHPTETQSSADTQSGSDSRNSSDTQNSVPTQNSSDTQSPQPDSSADTPSKKDE